MYVGLNSHFANNFVNYYYFNQFTVSRLSCLRYSLPILPPSGPAASHTPWPCLCLSYCPCQACEPSLQQFIAEPRILTGDGLCSPTISQRGQWDRGFAFMFLHLFWSLISLTYLCSLHAMDVCLKSIMSNAWFIYTSLMVSFYFLYSRILLRPLNLFI